METSAADAAIAAELRARRARANLKRSDLAQMSGVSESTILRIETERRSARIDQLTALCDALGIELRDFIWSATRSSERNPDLPSAPDEASHRKPWPGTHTPEAGTGALIEERDREIRRKQEEQSALHPDRSCL